MSIDGGVQGVGSGRGATPAQRGARTDAPGGAGFEQILRERLAAPKVAHGGGEVRWSSHAQQRLAQRQIDVTPEVQARLEGAVEKAAGKGARESLVLMDEVAVVVSVTNRTVITAMDRAAMRDNVFTNIDSAVLT